MGCKKVCFNCRTVISVYADNMENEASPCPECSGETHTVSNRFRPPAKESDKKWEVIELLINNGFAYHHVYANVARFDRGVEIDYPETMAEAKAFIIKYKDQAKFA